MMSSFTSLSHKPRNPTAYPSAAGPGEALGAVRKISGQGHLGLLEQGPSTLSAWDSRSHRTCPHSRELSVGGSLWATKGSSTHNKDWEGGQGLSPFLLSTFLSVV